MRGARNKTQNLWHALQHLQLTRTGSGFVACVEGAVFEPAVSWVKSVAEMTSTVTVSSGGVDKGFAATESTVSVGATANWGWQMWHQYWVEERIKFY